MAAKKTLTKTDDTVASSKDNESLEHSGGGTPTRSDATDLGVPIRERPLPSLVERAGSLLKAARPMSTCRVGAHEVAEHFDVPKGVAGGALRQLGGGSLDVI